MALGTLDRDHSWDIDGILVGNATGAVWKHVSSSGFDLPPYRINDEDKPQADGALFLGSDLMEKRVIEMSIGADSQYGTASQALIDALKAVMAPRNSEFPLRWRYNQASARRLYVRPRRCTFDVDELTTHGLILAHLQFDAGDPVIYDDVEQLITLTPIGTVGGLSFPHTFPQGFGATTGNSQILLNSGQWPAKISGRVTATGGGISRFSLENQTTGETFAMNLNMSAGDFVDFDFGQKVVLLGGTASRSNAVDRPNFDDWWRALPGNNSIAMHVNGVGGGSALADIRWRSANV